MKEGFLEKIEFFSYLYPVVFLFFIREAMK
jgi:hypothetical protein